MPEWQDFADLLTLYLWGNTLAAILKGSPIQVMVVTTTLLPSDFTFYPKLCPTVSKYATWLAQTAPLISMDMDKVQGDAGIFPVEIQWWALPIKGLSTWDKTALWLFPTQVLLNTKNDLKNKIWDIFVDISLARFPRRRSTSDSEPHLPPAISLVPHLCRCTTKPCWYLAMTVGRFGSNRIPPGFQHLGKSMKWPPQSSLHRPVSQVSKASYPSHLDPAGAAGGHLSILTRNSPSR